MHWVCMWEGVHTTTKRWLIILIVILTLRRHSISEMRTYIQEVGSYSFEIYHMTLWFMQSSLSSDNEARVSFCWTHCVVNFCCCFLFCLFFYLSYPEMLRGYSRLYSLGSLLPVFRGEYGIQGIKPRIGACQTSALPVVSRPDSLAVHFYLGHRLV